MTLGEIVTRKPGITRRREQISARAGEKGTTTNQERRDTVDPWLMVEDTAPQPYFSTPVASQSLNRLPMPHFCTRAVP
ncbi:hypothetical protein ACFWPK_11515 [Nocardia sp. NPDC058519]|uniref:hypothetical protein n=1 Tax=unclassified Nocardia TaxID=2637762 RepID=UPI00366686EE